jgi:REP element-mobilizing transposase RayT
MHLNDIGKIANQCLKNIPDHLSMVELDEFVIMPNHIHGIIVVVPDDRISRRDLINQTPANNWILMKNPKQTLGKILRWYKARAAKIIHDSGETGFQWQRNYYDHIIRNESELTAIRNYISNNPIYWWHDIGNPNTESERFQR